MILNLMMIKIINSLIKLKLITSIIFMKIIMIGLLIDEKQILMNQNL